MKELSQLLRHYWSLAIAIPVAGALLVVVASLCIPAKYEAVSTVTVSDPSGNVSTSNMFAVVNSFIQSNGKPYFAKDSDVKVSVAIGAGASAQTLEIAVEGLDEARCIEVANSLALASVADAEKLFDTLQEANEAQREALSSLNTSEDVAAVLSGSLLQDVVGTAQTFEFCSFMVNEAIDAEATGVGVAYLAVIGFVGGFVLAVIGVAAINVFKRPIKGREDIAAVSELPVLDTNNGSTLGDELWANIQFLGDGFVDSVCLVPLSDNSAQVWSEALESAVVRFGRSVQVDKVEGAAPFISNPVSCKLNIYVCKPLTDGVAAAYAAQAASATVICARTWADTTISLENTVRELSIAKANILGVVLLERRKGYFEKFA